VDEGLFVHYLHSELVPLVSTLREIMFNTCYMLFVYACLMLICHMFIRIVILYLRQVDFLKLWFIWCPIQMIVGRSTRGQIQSQCIEAIPV